MFENLSDNFNSILIADYYSANRMFVRLTGIQAQWCWARRIKKRFTRKDKDGYFLFLKNSDVEPTNNATEQKNRFVVLDRRVTQGTNSDAGIRFYERVWTVIATRTAHRKNIFTFFRDSLKAYYANTPEPKLIP